MKRAPVTWNNIWVISDTHLKSGENLPVSFINRLGREDLIIHLGDFTSLDVVYFLESVAALEGVSGNSDNSDVRNIFPPRKIIELGGFSIGLTHGSGSATDTIGAARREFENKVDIALFGHTHKSCSFKSGRTLFFNPGSLTRGRGAGVGFGLLRLDENPRAEYRQI